MKIDRFFFLLTIVVIISAFLIYFFYNYSTIEDITILNMSVKFGDHFGINVDADAIKFGMIMPGTSSQRSIVVNNNATYPLKVVLMKSGYMADWVEISENNFILEGNESRQIIFEVNAPENSKFGNYTGKVKVILKRMYLNR